MKRIAIIAVLILGSFGISASAQQLQVGGLLANRDIMTTSDLFELSQTQLNFGTARSMAMGGAFTSLGADLSSMAINPAGIGMYRGGDISVTPMMSFQNSSTNADRYGRNGINRFSVGNFGFVLNAYEGSRGLLSLNVGFGYNRIADLNYQQTFSREGTGNDGSIADLFSMIMTDYQVDRNKIPNGNKLKWGNFDPVLWTSILGYKCGLTDQLSNGEWAPTWIGNGAIIDHYTHVESRGAIGEYDLSIGANINNIIYIGATLGLQSLHQEKYYDYSEAYRYNDMPTLDNRLINSNFNQAVILDGIGINFKLGITVRPVKNLRLGFALHTPTYYSVDRKFQSYMSASANVINDTGSTSVAYNDIATDVLTDNGPDSWDFASPARMMFGASYTFGSRGLISVDYERDWFNGIRMKSNPASLNNQSFYNDVFRNNYKGSNTVRVGAEFKPTPVIALRAGFGYQGSMHKDDQFSPTLSPETTSVTYYSAGVGFQLGQGFYLDLAYQYNTTETSEYMLFFAQSAKNNTASGVYKTQYVRHIAALTLGYKF